MSEHTIEDPRVETERRNTEQEKEVAMIMAPANRQLIAATFNLAELPDDLAMPPENEWRRKRAEEDWENVQRWVNDREALYGFASGVLAEKDDIALSDREAAIEAAAKDPEYDLAMKDPAVYFQRIVGGLAHFYEPRTEGARQRTFTFAHQGTGVGATAIREISYTMGKNSHLPDTFSIDFDLPPGYAYEGRLSFGKDHELIAKKTAGKREVLATDNETPALYQAAASLLYRAVCNYTPNDDPVATAELHWAPPVYGAENTKPSRRRIYTTDNVVVSNGNVLPAAKPARPIQNHPSL